MLLFKCNIIILITIFSEILFCQNIRTDSIYNKLQSLDEPTNIKIEKYFFNTKKTLGFNSFLSKLPDSLFIPIYDYNLRLSEDNYYLQYNLFEEQERVNDQLTNYFKFQKEVADQKRLGEIEKILGQARTVSAFVLAIIHLIKYKKHYVK